MTDVRPVARLLRPLTTTLLVLFLLMAGIGIAGLLAVDRAFAELTRSIEPAADASRALMADMVNMETGVRAYAQSGLSSGLRPYRAAQDTYTENRRTLGDFAESDAELLAAVRLQDDAVRAWLTDYAVPRISSPGGPGTYSPERFARGTRRFDELRAANAAVDDVFTVRVEGAASRADWWLRGTLGVLALLAVSAVAAITRVFLNVLSNAVKFSRDDGSVEVIVERSGDEVAVVVRDQGIGIPADDLDKLGGRFFRASNAVTQHVSGTGLGLRIVQTIVAKHGGTMAIESVVDEGTSVTVRLPLQA